jgi:MoaA/NifB/PqqE/SkfB family radical SAM enzyme
MFKFDELETVQIEITSRCQASCPMCSRNFHGGISNPRLKNSDWSLDDFKNVFNDILLKQIKKINFCGSFGDPIINSNLIDMCDYIKKNSPHIKINLHTNGSARTIDWWKSLAKAMPDDHLITFGIDGLEDTHSLYRIGTDFNKIIENASAFISEGGNAVWAFIKFKHNAHQVDEASTRSKKLGFKSFTLKNSIRFSNEPFEVYHADRSVLYTIEPPDDNQVIFVDKDLVKNFQTWFDNTTPDCHVLKNKEIYIDAFKTVFPCCWIASVFYMYDEPSDFRYPYIQRIEVECNKLIDKLGGWNFLSFDNNSIKDIIDSEPWQTIWDYYWNEKKLLICTKNCGVSTFKNISKTTDQVIKKI